MSILAAAGLTAGANLVGGLIGASESRRAAERNANLQREFAQHGVRWRVQDAQAAGIHPLAALGMSPTEATPVHVGANPAAGIPKAADKMFDAVLQEKVQSGRLRAYETMEAKYRAGIKQMEAESMHMNLLEQKENFTKGIRGKKGESRLNPKNLYTYAKDPHSGKIFAIPIQDVGEGTDSSVAKGVFYYGNVRDHGKNIFDWMESGAGNFVERR